MKDGACDPAPHREAQQGDGNIRNERSKRGKSRYSIVFTRAPVNGSAALAESRIVEDERGNAMEGEKLLRGKPVLDDFPDSVTDEKSGFRALGRRDEDGIQGVRSALDCGARDSHARELMPWAKTPQESVAKSKSTTDESHCDGKDKVLHASREDFLAASRYVPCQRPNTREYCATQADTTSEAARLFTPLRSTFPVPRKGIALTRTN